MGFSLCIMGLDGEVEHRNDDVIVDEETIRYFYRLGKYPKLAEFANYDPYGITEIEGPDLIDLMIEAKALERESKERTLDLRPPSFVGVDGRSNPTWGEKFGWGGLNRFAKSLVQLVRIAQKSGKTLVAVGD